MKLRTIKFATMLLALAFLLSACQKTEEANNNSSESKAESSVDMTVESTVESQTSVESTASIKRVETKQLHFETIKTVLDYDIKDMSDTYESIKFGKWEQDNNIENDEEDIEWIVLNKDGNKFLLLSKYVLDRFPYNEDQYLDIEWKNATLRNWLNTGFYDGAFNEEEKQAMIRNTYPNYAIDYGTLLPRGKVGYSDSSTEDIVTLLGYQELAAYMGAPGEDEKSLSHNRRLVAKATPYARGKERVLGAVLDVETMNVWYKGCAPWWLRSTFVLTNGNKTNCGAEILANGKVINLSAWEEFAGVRPMICIDISKISDEKAKYMLTFNPNQIIGQNTEEETTMPKSLEAWEMTYFAESFTQFKHRFEDDRRSYENEVNREHKPAYVTEADGTVVFTYGLRDIDRDNVKELLIYNHGNLFTVYKLANKYYPDAPEYSTGFYPIELEVIRNWVYSNQQVTAMLYEDNYINRFQVDESKEDFANDPYYQQASEAQKQEWFKINNYTLYSYDTMYLKDEEFEWTDSYQYQTNEDDGLGVFTDKDYNESRISKAEADILFAKHGNPVILNDASFVLR